MSSGLITTFAALSSRARTGSSISAFPCGARGKMRSASSSPLLETERLAGTGNTLNTDRLQPTTDGRRHEFDGPVAISVEEFLVDLTCSGSEFRSLIPAGTAGSPPEQRQIDLVVDNSTLKTEGVSITWRVFLSFVSQ